ncbi:MAG: hypothetical protein M1826_003545 [Phylliscum demangeonii]|nr:MAG: hypothetical protein M1826_003545 [Phylliscum demangeonii]
MHALRRAIEPCSRRIARPRKPLQGRRFDSTHPSSQPPGHEAPHDHQDHHHDHHGSEPVNEYFGRGFFICLSVIPVSLALYKLSHETESGQPALTRYIAWISDYGTEWEERNAAHTRMVEQAGRDRLLFYNSKGSSTIQLKFPEMFNVGSPHNVIAGQGSINLDKVIEKYERERRESEERKIQRLMAKEDERRKLNEAASKQMDP